MYDDRYRLTEETDERGNKTTYTYNADNTPKSVKLPNGEVINYEYDEFFRVSKITKGGKSIEYEYLYDMPVKVCTDERRQLRYGAQRGRNSENRIRQIRKRNCR